MIKCDYVPHVVEVYAVFVFLCYLDSTESKVAGVYFPTFFTYLIRNPVDQPHTHGRKLPYYRFYYNCFSSFKK